MGHKDVDQKEKKKQHKEKHSHKEDEKKRHLDKEKEDRKSSDKEQKECQAPDYHKMHLCVLKHMGQMQLLDELSENPTHRCSRCGCSTNNRKNLCQPYEL